MLAHGTERRVGSETTYNWPFGPEGTVPILVGFEVIDKSLLTNRET